MGWTLLAVLCAGPAPAQTTLYWDTNGTTAGAGGSTPTGTWKTAGLANKNWNTAANGTATTANWTNDSIAVFSAGTDATGAYVVTLASAPTVDSLFIEEGDVTFTNSSLTLTGVNPVIDVASGTSATFDAKLLGSNGLVKDGAGLLVLNNTGNNYTGSTLVLQGTVQIGSGANLLPSTTDLVISAGAAVNIVSSASTQTVNSLAGAGTLDIGDNLFRIVGTGDTEFSGAIADSGGTLRMQSTGTLTLSGNSTFSGALDLNTGVIKLAHDNALGAASSGNDIASGAALHLSGGINVAEADLVIRGAGDGSGALRSLDGSNTLATALSLSTASTIAADGGSTFTLSGNISRAGQNLTVTGAGDTVLSGVLAGSGSAQLIKDGTGTLTLSGADANTNTGAINLNDGLLQLAKTAGVAATGGGAVTVGDGSGAPGSAILRLGADNQLPDTSALLTVNADGRLDLNNHAETIDRIAGTGEIDFGSGGALTVGADDGDSTFSGTFAGTGDFTKTGTGSLTLDTDLLFESTFTLAGGTLRLSNSTLTVDSFEVSEDSIIDFAGISALFATNFTIATGVTLTIQNWADASDYFFAKSWTGAGFDTTGADPMSQVVFNGALANDTKWLGYENNPGTGYHQITPVPEPAAYGALLLAAAGGLLTWRRRVSRPGV